MKKYVIALVLAVLAGLSIYFLTSDSRKEVVVTKTPVVTEEPAVTTETPKNKEMTVIGKSVAGNDITAYHFGTGSDELLFVGGIHGGYEWNTVLVAQKLIEYLKQNPKSIPENVKVTVVPVLNPDGLNKVVGKTNGDFTKADVSTSVATVESGRFNGNKVDLNRNFDCDWQLEGKWQTKSVSGGSAAFSEPESQAIKNYVDSSKPKAVVTWYSAAGGVFSSNCHNGVLPQTETLTKLYAKASGYPAYESFNFYEITGDMVNWFAKQNIPAISVLLTNHDDIEWSKNQAGIEAVLKSYAK